MNLNSGAYIKALFLNTKQMQHLCEPETGKLGHKRKKVDQHDKKKEV